MVWPVEGLGRVSCLELSPNNILIILVGVTLEKARVHCFLLLLAHLCRITAFSVPSWAAWAWVLSLLRGSFAAVDLNVDGWAVVDCVVWMLIYHTSLGPLVGYCFLWRNIALVYCDGGYPIDWRVMDQFGIQTVDLALVISFLQLVNQTVTYPEVLLHKHIVLPLSSRVGLVLRDYWHLSFLAQ